jgi:hypothetical protein
MAAFLHGRIPYRFFGTGGSSTVLMGNIPILAAHHRAGDTKPVYLGHSQFEGFEVRQTVGLGKAEVA